MENIKKCSGCKKAKTEGSFAFRKDTGKLRNKCKDCEKLYFAKRYAKKADEEREKRREHYKNNKKQYKERAKEWKRANPEKVKASNRKAYYRDIEITRERERVRSKKYREKYPDRIRKTKRKYRKNKKYTIQERISGNLRSRFRAAIRGNYKTGSAVKDLGCSIAELKEYLEQRFDAGMSWENYGKHGWHIDHIMPLSMFDLTDPEQVKCACHYTNLQPLWAKDNLSKGAKII
jgi:hypothetical protein